MTITVFNWAILIKYMLIFFASASAAIVGFWLLYFTHKLITKKVEK